MSRLDFGGDAVPKGTETGRLMGPIFLSTNGTPSQNAQVCSLSTRHQASRDNRHTYIKWTMCFSGTQG